MLVLQKGRSGIDARIRNKHRPDDSSPLAAKRHRPQGKLSPLGALDSPSIVFLFDVDNTLLDNDRIIADLGKDLKQELGRGQERRYWDILEQLRSQFGYADYLGALQRFQIECPFNTGLVAISRFLLAYPFARRLFPDALNVVSRVKKWGAVVLLTDGDPVFQPRKVERSGLLGAVDGCALIYAHKEDELADVEAHYPADHYVMIDDKLRILDAIKKIWDKKVTTVFVRQGHYARDPGILAAYPAADVSIGCIGELMRSTLSDFVV
jgi:FMN phosphatase YigB (HAD superfamily)